jgi:hypothetical protein
LEVFASAGKADSAGRAQSGIDLLAIDQESTGFTISDGNGSGRSEDELGGEARGGDEQCKGAK